MTKRVAGAFTAVRYKVPYMAKQINFSHILYHNNKFTSTVVCYTFVWITLFFYWEFTTIHYRIFPLVGNGNYIIYLCTSIWEKCIQKLLKSYLRLPQSGIGYPRYV